MLMLIYLFINLLFILRSNTSNIQNVSCVAVALVDNSGTTFLQMTSSEAVAVAAAVTWR